MKTLGSIVQDSNRDLFCITVDYTAYDAARYMAEHNITQIWPANERVLVGFDHRPHTRQVLRDAWRLAHGLRAELLAISIEPEGYQALTGKERE